MEGGMHGRGECMAGQHVWQGGVHGRGGVWSDACVAGGACMEGWGMCGRGACVAGGVCGRGACMADTMRYSQ